MVMNNTIVLIILIILLTLSFTTDCGWACQGTALGIISISLLTSIGLNI